MTQFSDFGFADPLAQAIAAAGLTTPTPIQAQAIPHVLEGRDVLGIAQTGTGKTLSFVGPIIHGLVDHPEPRRKNAARALILAPTRELAAQIGQAATAYAARTAITSAVVVGGVPIGKHIRRLAHGVDVLVATPGRLLDLIDRRAFDPRHVQILVLDEADQMLDLGFIHPLRRIAGLIPSGRQTLFFSATMAKEILALSKDFLTDPVKVEVTPPAKTADRVEQSVIFTPQGEKLDALAAIIRRKELKNAIVFTRTKHGADKLVKKLAAQDLDSRAIHGGKAQGQRQRALKAFKEGEVPVLIATDIAARGLDISGLSHVVNFELPNVPEQYVHRIGRTGRAGATGLAVSLVDGGERAYLRDIERLIGKRIPVQTLDGTVVETPVDEPRERSGRPARGPRPGGPGRKPQHARGQDDVAAKPKRRRRKPQHTSASGAANASGASAKPARGPRPQGKPGGDTAKNAERRIARKGDGRGRGGKPAAPGRAAERA